jgi:hypothetical protein
VGTSALQRPQPVIWHTVLLHQLTSTPTWLYYMCLHNTRLQYAQSQTVNPGLDLMWCAHTPAASSNHAYRHMRNQLQPRSAARTAPNVVVRLFCTHLDAAASPLAYVSTTKWSACRVHSSAAGQSARRASCSASLPSIPRVTRTVRFEMMSAVLAADSGARPRPGLLNHRHTQQTI